MQSKNPDPALSKSYQWTQNLAWILVPHSLKPSILHWSWCVGIWCLSFKVRRCKRCGNWEIEWRNIGMKVGDSKINPLKLSKHWLLHDVNSMIHSWSSTNLLFGWHRVTSMARYGEDAFSCCWGHCLRVECLRQLCMSLGLRGSKGTSCLSGAWWGTHCIGVRFESLKRPPVLQRCIFDTPIWGYIIDATRVFTCLMSHSEVTFYTIMIQFGCFSPLLRSFHFLPLWSIRCKIWCLR